MARNLKFYGASYNLFKCKGTHGDEPDEIDACNKMVSVIIQNEHAGLRVFGYYVDPGVWMIGIAQRDEDDPIPDWPIKYTTHKMGYSAYVEIEAPDSVIVSKDQECDV